MISPHSSLCILFNSLPSGCFKPTPALHQGREKIPLFQITAIAAIPWESPREHKRKEPGGIGNAYPKSTIGTNGPAHARASLTSDQPNVISMSSSFHQPLSTTPYRMTELYIKLSLSRLFLKLSAFMPFSANHRVY